jgi:tetratricopeptide (TPR) repeat protein
VDSGHRPSPIVVFFTIRSLTLSSHRSRRFALIAILVISVCVWLAYVVTRDPIDRLVAAATEPDFRVTEGRLYQSPYARRPRTGLTLAERSQVNPDLPEFAAKVVSIGVKRSQYAAGVAQLVTGHVDRAVKSLTAATSSHTDRAEAWNELSVAYLESYLRDHDIRAGLRALAAARRSVELREAPAPLFNLAVALQTIGLRDASLAAIDRYLHLDPNSPWADELRERRLGMKHVSFAARISALQIAVAKGDAKTTDAIVAQYPQQARTWCETMFFAQWGKEHLEKRSDRELAFIEEIGGALRRVNGDAEIADAAEVIRRKISSGESASVDALARAHVDYDLARQLFARRDVEASIPPFRESLRAFAAEGSAMSYVARYYIASAWLDHNQTSTAQGMLENIARELPPMYRALRAQVTWELGTAVGRQGAIYESVVLYQRAVREFDALNERENATTVRSALTHSLTSLGRSEEAWGIRLRIFADAANTERPETLHAAFSAAGHDALLDRDWTIAETIFSLGLDSQHLGPGLNLRRRVRYLVSRAQASWELGHHEDAWADLRRAALSASSIRSQALNDASAVDVALAEARLIRDSEPALAIELLSNGIDFLESTQQTADIVPLYLERARAHRVKGDRWAWTSDLRRAVDLVENRRRLTETQSDDYIATEREVFAEATDCLEAQQPEEAFAIADAGRMRLVDDRTDNVTVASVRPMLDGSLMAHYTVIGSEVVIFWMTKTEFGHARVRFDPHDPSLLLQPFALRIAAVRRLIIVADGALSRIPFASLRNPASGRLLIEDVAVVIAPSASFYVQSRRGTHVRSKRLRAVVVGDPAFDPGLFPHYERLSGAAAEAREIAALYEHVALLSNSDATTDRFLEAAGSADIIHIGAHAETTRDPALTALLFAPSRGHSGALTVRAIKQGLDLHDRFVVLAACRTGQTDGLGAANLAFAFLSTGSMTVVGTIRDIPDDSSRFFSVELHRLLKTGKAPAEALRATQLTMAHSPNSRLHDPNVWSAFQIYGNGD